jgi:type 1 glutamine amidotransferase
MRRSAGHVDLRFVTITLAALMGGCGGGASTPGGAGQSGATGGGAGGTSSAGASGSVGSAGAAGQSGSSGAVGGGTAGTGGGSVAGSSGQPDANTSVPDAAADGGPGAGGAGGNADAGTSPTNAARSNKVLIYGVTTGFRHGSITAGANAITKAAATVGLTTEIVGGTDATNKADPTKFTPAALAQYGAVILLANSGEPFGYPATQEIQNLVDYVQHGGALISVEDADHCYDGQFNGHPASQPYVNLIGNDFVGHPGGVAPATCTKMGTQASVAQLPATFGTTDEIYATTMFRMDNQVVLTCVSSGDGTHTMRPVSYVREEGAGRTFFTALGHNDVSWTAPMDAKAPSSRLVEDHLIPALLWAMRR